MIALSLGIFAALCWSCHDLFARVLSQSLGPFRLSFWVMVAGAVVLIVPVSARGLLIATGEHGLTVAWVGPRLDFLEPALWAALAMGFAYAGGFAALLKAFSLAPISIVGPFTAGYPALVVFWNVIRGLTPSSAEWLALVFCIAGVAIVGTTGPKDGGINSIAKGKLGVVVLTCVLASACFASTVVLGQAAAQTLGAYETTLIARFPAAFVLLPFALRDRGAVSAISFKGWLSVFAMASLDVAAMSGVNAAGFFPGAEYSAMGISAYAAIAVIMAMLVLKEKVSPGQWAGIALIVAGIAILGWPRI